MPTYKNDPLDLGGFLTIDDIQILGVSESQFFIYFAFRLFRNVFTIQSPSQKILVINLTFKPMEITSYSYLPCAIIISYSRTKYYASLWNGTPPLQSGNAHLKEESRVRRNRQNRKCCKNSQTIEVYLPAKQDCKLEKLSLFSRRGVTVILAYRWEGTDFCQMAQFSRHCGIVVKYPPSKNPLH